LLFPAKIDLAGKTALAEMLSRAKFISLSGLASAASPGEAASLEADR
jgi:hypothetical protein